MVRENKTVVDDVSGRLLKQVTLPTGPPKLPKDLSPLHLQIQQTLRSRKLIKPASSVLIAVSGGQDSLCLGKVLFDLRGAWDWQLAVAHCDHQWRSDSAANAEHVQQIAHTWQLPYYQRTASSRLRGEDAAREWRYQMLAELAVAGSHDIVVTGHTATDRAETLLLNLMRGSSADGMQALAWQRPLCPGVMLVRPLLGVRRPDTAAFCEQMELPVWDDSTNSDNSLRRNRIRNELMPYLRQHFNPRVDQALSRAAEVASADVAYLEQQASELLGRASRLQSTGQGLPLPSVSRAVLRAAPLALRRRAVRQLLTPLLLPKPCGLDAVEKFLALLDAPNRTRSDSFSGRTSAYVDGDFIVTDAVARPAEAAAPAAPAAAGEEEEAGATFGALELADLKSG